MGQAVEVEPLAPAQVVVELQALPQRIAIGTDWRRRVSAERVAGRSAPRRHAPPPPHAAREQARRSMSLPTSPSLRALLPMRQTDRTWVIAPRAPPVLRRPGQRPRSCRHHEGRFGHVRRRVASNKRRCVYRLYGVLSQSAHALVVGDGGTRRPARARLFSRRGASSSGSMSIHFGSPCARLRPGLDSELP